MRKKIISGILIFFTIASLNVFSCAKYIKDVDLTVANINLDRTMPKLNYDGWYIINSYVASNVKKYNITMGITIIEKNLAEDVIKRDKIKTWVDDVETELEIKMEETAHTEEEHKYEVQILNVPVKKRFVIEFREGAVTDKAGWENTRNTIDLSVFT